LNAVHGSTPALDGGVAIERITALGARDQNGPACAKVRLKKDLVYSNSNSGFQNRFDQGRSLGAAVVHFVRPSPFIDPRLARPTIEAPQF
jgi:hypothetical protein